MSHKSSVKSSKFSFGETKWPFLSKTVLFIFIALPFFAFFSTRWINKSIVSENISSEGSAPKVIQVHNQPTTMRATQAIIRTNDSNKIPHLQPKLQLQPPKQQQQPASVLPFTCPAGNVTLHLFCHSAEETALFTSDQSLQPSEACPEYFRWIYEDLKPWRETGITSEMVQQASRTASFRLVTLDGRAYVERYRKSFQSRDTFTLWGILQMLRRYPGMVPDLDLMFDCVDWPVVRASAYRRRRGMAASTVLAPPPLFRYCGDDSTLDIVFPDWSFWGWPEINIKPWEQLRKDLKIGNEKVNWIDREPYAYWKGNPAVAATRQDLLRCNVSKSHDWNARLYAQDWLKESREGFKESNLASQCIHRYKIYIEGSAWSVSEKYILACNSLALVVKPRYYDFFTRGLMPVQHYWPIRDDDKCRSIKFAVDWGNSHKQKAQAIGRETSNFMQENLKMDHIYSYMFHLLNEYSKLLKYKPAKPPRATELCSELMACSAKGLEKAFMMDSMVKTTHDSGPCTLPPPLTPVELKVIKRRKENAEKQVEMWEQKARENNS